MKTIDGFPGKTLGLLADLMLKLKAGSLTTGELEKLTKRETLFCDMLVIPVDRARKAVMPTPPSGCGPYNPKPVYPKLHNSGLERLQFSRIQLYFVGLQDCPTGIHADDLHKHLVETGKIEQCLNLRDGEELASHLQYFPPEWSRRQLLLWKSLARDAHGDLFVPSLYESTDEKRVKLGWVHMAIYTGFCPTALYV